MALIPLSLASALGDVHSGASSRSRGCKDVDLGSFPWLTWRLFHKNPPSLKGDSQPFRERIFSFYETAVAGKNIPSGEGDSQRISFPPKDFENILSRKG